MKTLSKDKSWALVRSVALSLVPQLQASPEVTKQCLTALRNHDGRAIAELAVRPGDYSSALHYRRDAQCVDLLRKFAGLPSGIDTRAVAITGFLKMEEKCRDVNDSLHRSLLDPSTLDIELTTILYRTSKLIKEILGRAPQLQNLRFAFGPGATSQCRSHEPKSNKYAQKVHCTALLAEHWLASSSRHGPIIPLSIRYDMSPILRGYEKIDTVPKTAKTDRTIGVPVHLNAFVQRGIGLAIRDKLDSYIGINLSEVPAYHALLAGVAHIDGLSTIDLSSASDTVSFVLIKELMPPDWFDLLLMSRVAHYELDSKIHPYEKFSAMGNGYTFELETLVFYALAVVATAMEGETNTTAVKHLVSVFGDDIICQRRSSQTVVDVLERAGFIVNAEKTFLDGAFFESCGSDFFNGHPVRSVFIKELKTPQDVIVLYNAVIALSQRECALGYRDKRFRKTAVFLEHVLRTWFDQDFSQCRVPSGYTHGLVSSFDEAKPSLVPSRETRERTKSLSFDGRNIRHLRQGWQGWQLKYCQFVPFTHDSSQSKLGLDRWLFERSHVPIDQTARSGIELSGCEARDPMIVSTESIRKRGRYSVGRTIHSLEWIGPGPWV